jgi:hypothetical protein
LDTTFQWGFSGPLVSGDSESPWAEAALCASLCLAQWDSQGTPSISTTVLKITSLTTSGSVPNSRPPLTAGRAGSASIYGSTLASWEHWVAGVIVKTYCHLDVFRHWPTLVKPLDTVSGSVSIPQIHRGWVGLGTEHTGDGSALSPDIWGLSWEASKGRGWTGSFSTSSPCWKAGHCWDYPLEPGNTASPCHLDVSPWTAGPQEMLTMSESPGENCVGFSSPVFQILLVTRVSSTGLVGAWHSHTTLIDRRDGCDHLGKCNLPLSPSQNNVFNE